MSGRVYTVADFAERMQRHMERRQETRAARERRARLHMARKLQALDERPFNWASRREKERKRAAALSWPLWRFGR